MLYAVMRQLVRSFFLVFYRFRAAGTEQVPKEGPVIICANHFSNFDPLLVGCACPRRVSFMAKEELFRVPLLSQLIRALGAFPVRRGGGDRQAIKTAMQLLKEKRAVCIFPEGTRSKTGELGHFHLGAALIALKTRSPIVPVAIVGPYRLFRPIRVIFGEPIDPSSFLGGENDKEAAGRLTETLQNRIRQMMESHR